MSFIPYLQGKSVEQPWYLLLLESLAWLSLWALLKRPRWFHWLLLPAFLAVPVEIYLRIYFGQGISTHHLGVMFETSPKESLEFLGNQVWGLLAVSIAMIGWWLLIGLTVWRNSVLDWTHWSRWFAFTCVILGAGIVLYSTQLKINDERQAPSTSNQPPTTQLPKLPAWARVNFPTEQFARTWPFGLVARGLDFLSERRYLSTLSEKSITFRFKAHQLENHNNVPQTFILVIGESSRYDRWSINGYQRDTNPLLRKETNLVSFSDMVTAVAATRLSVPIIVSRKSAVQSLQAGFAEKSFLSAFKEAGFKTFWLSNQMSFGQFDTPTSVFAKEADVTQFLNLGDFTNSSNYDQVLLAPMRNALHDAAPKKLIVLHTLGNHWNYSQRHPKEYDRWHPSLFGISNPDYSNRDNKDALNNSYDNSVLYVDWVLSEVIQQLKQTQQMTALLYVSDHGQLLYDGSCSLAFHGHNTQYEFHIPAFMWYSDRYQDAHPDKIVQLIKHRSARLSTENVFHSLLDMADIHYADEKPDWSFLNTQLKRHTRYVDSYGWTNYDDATFKGDCREVMDKKVPLKQ